MSTTPVRADGKTALANGISPVPDPPIRTLKVELLSHNSSKYVPVIPNGREPTPFETEFFKGIAQIVIRTAPIDKNFECFFVGRRRLFEVQVQGKFKREPAGEIYVGAEASCKMEIGLITRSISLAAMKLCSTMVNDMHYAFGDSLDNPNHQLPHVVGPIFPTMDKVIVTPPGETPPRLGIPFTEDLEYRKERLKFKSIEEAQVKLDHTYSFSVNTSNLNLLEWTMVNIPMVKPMDLRTFFGSASIQLVGYEMPRSVAAKFPNSHPKKLMNYVFNMKLTPVEPDAMPILDLPTLESEDENGNEEEETGAGKETDMLTSPPPETTDMVSETEEEEEEAQFDEKIVKNLEDSFAKERDLPASARTMSTASGISSLLAQQRKVTGERTTVGSWLRKKFARINRSSTSTTTSSTRKTSSTIAADDLEEGEVNESTEMSESMDWEYENVADLNFCPGCIELNDSKRDGRGKFSYFLALHPALEVTPSTATGDAQPDYHPNAPRIKSYSEIAKILPLVPLPKLPKNRRLSPLEKRRRQIVESYRQLLKDPASPAFKKFQSAMVHITDTERNFLQSSSHFVNERRNTRDGLTSWESSVALVLSRRHYLEQSMVLTVTDLIFRRSSESKRNQIHIPLDHILSVQPLPVEQCPMVPFACLQIETFARVFCVLLYSDTLVNEWIPLFSRAMGRDCMISPHRLHINAGLDASSSFSSNVVPSSETAADVNPNGNINGPISSTGINNNPANALGRPSGQSRSATITNDSFLDREEFFLARPACWKLDKRRVFNYRRVHFKPVLSHQNVSTTATGTAGTTTTTTTTTTTSTARHPCDLVASLLSAAFYLSHVLNSEQSRVTDSDWIRFWDELSLLQTISLVDLTEPEKMAFFLNLYHVMVVHGSMVYGPPPAWNHWNAFYNQIAYLVAGELVSIAEIEYCILKANMSRSYMFTSVAMPAPPTSSFPHLALKSRDFRLHFAINCGSLSNLDVVPIYTPELLDSQLDLVTRLSLEIALEVDVSKKTVTMPRLPMIDYQSVSDQIYFPNPATVNTASTSSVATSSSTANTGATASLSTNNTNITTNSNFPASGANASKPTTVSPLPVSTNSVAITTTTSSSNNTNNTNNNNTASATLSEADLALASASSSGSNNPSVIEATLNCLYALLPYVSKPLRAQLRALLQDGKNLTLRYRPYNFRCCMLGKLTAYRSSPLSSNALSQMQQEATTNSNNNSNNANVNA